MNDGDETTSTRIERLRELAGLGSDQIRMLFATHAEELRGWLSGFIEEEMLDTGLPPLETADEFSSAIQLLAENKRLWANRLERIVIAVADGVQGAEDQIAEYAKECPWRFLRAAARNA